MDPLSVSASLVTLLQTARLFLHFAGNVRNAPTEKDILVKELKCLVSLVEILHKRVESASPDDSWFEQVKILGKPGGLIHQMNASLIQLQNKTRPQGKTLARIQSRLAWNFDKKEVDSVLLTIDRFVASINLALGDDHFKLSLQIRDDISKTADSITRILEGAEKQEYQAAIEWLKPPDSSQNHHRARQRHHEASGDWFLQELRFLRWLESPSCLWLYGKPGSGKTILRNDSSRSLAYFYCEFGNSLKQSSADFLCSLLVQLGHQNVEKMVAIRMLYRRHKKDLSRPDEGELRAALLDVISGKGHVYIVLDGLDETTSPTGIAKQVLELVERESSNTHVFVASRFDKDIKDELHLPNTILIELTAHLMVNDIHHYVKATLESDKKFTKWSPGMRKMVLKTIMEKSNGMFQWVYCQLEELRKCVSNSMVKKTLLALPKSLEETYERILNRIEEQGLTQYAVRIIQTLFCAYRRIRLAELIDLVAIDLGDVARFDEEDRLLDHEDVLQICSGMVLLIYDSEPFAPDSKYKSQADYNKARSKGPEVCISHVSVAEYLLSQRCRLSPSVSTASSERVLAHCCLTYLLYLRAAMDLKRSEILQQYPLATYAARFWFEHFNALDQEQIPENLMIAALTLLKDGPDGLRTWRRVLDLDHQFNEPIDLMVTGVGFSTWAAIKAETERRQAQIGKDIRGDAYNYQPGSALYYACLTGNIAIVKKMIKSGVDYKAFQGGTLSYAMNAARASNMLLLDYLRSLGADSDQCNEGYWEIAMMKAHVRARDSPYRWV